jgi:hypothetical protein
MVSFQGKWRRWRHRYWSWWIFCQHVFGIISNKHNTKLFQSFLFQLLESSTGANACRISTCKPSDFTIHGSRVHELLFRWCEQFTEAVVFAIQMVSFQGNWRFWRHRNWSWRIFCQHVFGIVSNKHTTKLFESSTGACNTVVLCSSFLFELLESSTGVRDTIVLCPSFLFQLLEPCVGARDTIIHCSSILFQLLESSTGALGIFHSSNWKWILEFLV